MKTKSEKRRAKVARKTTVKNIAVENVVTELVEVSEKPEKGNPKKGKKRAKSPEQETVQALDPRFNRRSKGGEITRPDGTKQILLPAKELTIREFGERMTPARASFIIACSLLQKSERFTEQEFAGVIGKHTRKSLEAIRATQPKAYPDGKIHRGLYALVSGSLQTGLTKDKKTGKMKPRWARGSIRCLAKTPRVGWGIGEYSMHPELRKSRGTVYPNPSSELLKTACETLV